MTPDHELTRDQIDSTHTADALQHTVMAGIDSLVELDAENHLWAIHRLLDRALFSVAKVKGFK